MRGDEAPYPGPQQLTFRPWQSFLIESSMVKHDEADKLLAEGNSNGV